MPRLAIENVSPSVDDGRFPAKRVVGEHVTVSADIIADGHDRLAAHLLWRAADEAEWRRTPMQPLGNDRWSASFTPARVGTYLFNVEAWRDEYGSFVDGLRKKISAGQDIRLELREAQAMLHEAASRVPELAGIVTQLEGFDDRDGANRLLAEQTQSLMRRADARPFAVRSQRDIPLSVDRIAARFASWYELFPRSMSGDPNRHGTFHDVIPHLPRIRDMGFDVLYFPPIHPIGRSNRKGRNNALRAEPDDPGSPYAIGDETGGHDAIHAQLGTLDDFHALREAAAAHGLELALDFAIQCSPDHPWLTNHPDWFDWRADGSLRYAENPPKKYEDIVNVDFYAPGAVPGLWQGLLDVVLHWVRNGVRIFRVDNPHTKPLPFWEWLIAEVRAQAPDAIFLAEAFTRPKMMYRLAKLGFTQSYTYFTWRNTPEEMREYLTELNQGPPASFFRPNFFVNTPDINPVFLQTSGRAGFLIRAALATTLAGLWGMYCGFELCEAAALAGREEYLDSEKYQLRTWDWNRAGHIIAEVTQLNAIRRLNPALQSHLGTTFLQCQDRDVLAYERHAPDRRNRLIVAVSFDPHGSHTAEIDIASWRWGLTDTATIVVDNLLTGQTEHWAGRNVSLRLTPERPYGIWRVVPA